MAWTTAEYEQVVAWRSEDPPVHYHVIGQRMGRTAESVRQKLISERVAAASGASRERNAWREFTPIGPRLGERVFQRRLMAGGGHSRFTEALNNDGLKSCYPVLRMPLIGPDGAPRPCGAMTCQCLAGQKRACANMPKPLKSDEKEVRA